MQDSKEYIVLGWSQEELEDAVERIDRHMDRRTGPNAIRYGLVDVAHGKTEAMPWDTGYITDEALEDMQRGFIVIPYAQEAGAVV